MIAKLLFLTGLLILLSMVFINVPIKERRVITPFLVGPRIIASELGSLFLNGPPAPTGAPTPKPTVESDTPPHRYAHQEYVHFQTPQGPRAGYVQDFFWFEQFQDWSYDIHSADGVVFENVLEKDITSVQEALVP